MQTQAPHSESPSPQRPLDVALRVLLRVEEGAYATLALTGELNRHALTDSEKALVTELCYGTLRQQLRLDRALSGHAPRGLHKLDATTKTLLRLGAYQLLFMQARPHFVVDAVVSTIKKKRGAGLSGFANALLRKLLTAKEPSLPPFPSESAPKSAWVSVLAQHHSLSEELTAQLWDVVQSPTELDELLRALGQPASTWLRINTLRGSPTEALTALRAELATAPTVHPQLPEAIELHGGHPFAGPAFAKGLVTAQDLGAQLVTQLLLCDSPDGKLTLPEGAILDGCAGIGGKTCHLAALLQNQRDIDAVDILPRKLELCRDHAHRLGCRRIRTIPTSLLERHSALRKRYAAVLLDAPCSGSGVLRRHPEARSKPLHMDELTTLQAQLLDRAAELLVPGGVLLYSVCSLIAAEGPSQIAAFLAKHPDFSPLPPSPSDPLFRSGPTPLCEPSSPFALRTLPHRHNADGFYAVRLLRACTARPTG